MKKDRCDLILKLIVEDYIETANPVGSENLIAKHNLDISSATVRSVMATLEKEGLLDKTHTSSGRVPSTAGIQYYLEKLRDQKNDEDKDNFAEEFAKQLRIAIYNKNKSVEEVMEQSCQYLSDITNLATVVLGPKASEEKLVSLQLLSLNEKTLAAILVTDKGYVENKTFVVPSNISATSIQMCIGLLNERLIGTPISALAEKANLIVPLLTEKLGQDASILLEAFKDALFHFTRNRITSFGTNKLLDLPEYSDDIEDMKDIINYLGNEEKVYNDIVDCINSDCTNDDIRVNLVKEDKRKNLAIVSKDINLPGLSQRQIAVVGPKRMDYKKVMAALKVMVRMLNDYFTMEKKDDEKK